MGAAIVAPGAFIDVTCAQNLSLALTGSMSGQIYGPFQVTCPGYTPPVGDFVSSVTLSASGSWTDSVSASRDIQFDFTEQSAQVFIPTISGLASGTTAGATGTLTGLSFGSTIADLFPFNVDIFVSVHSPDPEDTRINVFARYQVDGPVPIPEPATAALGAWAGVLFCLEVARKHKAR